MRFRNRRIAAYFYYSIISVFVCLIALTQQTAGSSKAPTKAHNDLEMDSLFSKIEKKLDALDISGLRYIDSAYFLALDKDMKDKLPQIYIFYGIYWKNLNEYRKSLEYSVKALKEYEKKNDRLGVADVNRLLGETYRASGNLMSALRSLNSAKAYYINSKDSAHLAAVYNRIAAVYFEMYTKESYTKCIKYARVSIDIAEEHDSYELLISNYNILGAAYRDLNNYDLAIDYFHKAQELIEKYSDEYDKCSVLDNLGETYLRMGDYKEAIAHASESLSISKKKNIVLNMGFAYDILSRSYAALNEYEKAYYMLGQSNIIKDSLFYISKNNALLEIEKKYESEKKENELYRQKQTQKYQIIISAVTIVSLAIFAMLFYFKQKEARRKNELIESQNKELSELNSTKDKFFSIMAHDLKNPIGTFKNMAELLADHLDAFDEDERKSSLQLIKISAHKLADLLENLLTWSRSQRGIISFEPIEVIPRIVIEDIVNLLNMQALEKDIALIPDIKAGPIVIADPNMLMTILRNLVSNAIKFTPNGGTVFVGTQIAADGLEFFVKDTGVGMEEDFLGKLFRIDINLSTIGTQKESGTGLGLIICKEFIEKHGSSLKVQSKVGIGSIFSFILPLASHEER